MANAIHLIAPYRWNGLWVFDDPQVGLHREPFVSGADVIITHATAHIRDADAGFLLVFSDQTFPSFTNAFIRGRPEGGGHWYKSPSLNMEGWLCPALLKYFDKAPEFIYTEFRAKGKRP